MNIFHTNHKSNAFLLFVKICDEGAHGRWIGWLSVTFSKSGNMITDSGKIIFLSAIAALVLAIIAAGSVAFSANAIMDRQALGKNVSTMEKNQVWPIKGDLTFQPCITNPCQDI